MAKNELSEPCRGNDMEIQPPLTLNQATRLYRFAQLLCYSPFLTKWIPMPARIRRFALIAFVLARGPVHEAFATPTTDPVAAKPVLKAPPTALEELPPSEKPEGNATWIGG